jgi:hypothetical protein
LITASGQAAEEYVEEKELLGVRSGVLLSVCTELKDSCLLCKVLDSSSVDDV